LQPALGNTVFQKKFGNFCHNLLTGKKLHQGFFLHYFEGLLQVGF
jgi:hypothetical protein